MGICINNPCHKQNNDFPMDNREATEYCSLPPENKGRYDKKYKISTQDINQKKPFDTANSTVVQTLEVIYKQKNKNPSLTIHLFGERETGKTTFVINYCSKKFESFYIPSINKEITMFDCILNMKVYHLQFIVNQFQNFVVSDIKSSDCFLIFFDFSESQSYIKAKEFINQIKEETSNKIEIPICLVGNKCDLKNKNFNLDEIQYFCKNENIVFFEISVKNNIGISKMMQYISSFGTKSDKE